MTTVLLFLLFGAVCYRLGHHSRAWQLERREAVVAWERWAAEQDRLTAVAIREQADEILFQAEWDAIAARALTTDTAELPTIRVRVASGWAGLKEWSQATFGRDEHEGWDGHADELTAIRRDFNSRAKWPLRARKPVTPLAMPQHLPPDPERALRVHTLGRMA